MNASFYHTFRVPCRTEISDKEQRSFPEKPWLQYSIDKGLVARADPEGAVLVTPNHATPPIFVDNELLIKLQNSPINASSIPTTSFNLLERSGILKKGASENSFQGMTTINIAKMPFWSAIETISTCQCHCWPCYRQDDLDGFQPPLSDIISRINKMQSFGITFFEITGGEPLLRDDLVKIIAHLNGLPVHHILVTNGEYLKDAKSDLLISLQSSHGVLISLDGIGAKHDLVRRRPGLFDKIILGLERLKEYGIKTYFNSTLYDYNINDVPGMIELARKYDTSIQLRPAIKTAAVEQNQLKPALITEALKETLRSTGAHNAFAAVGSTMPPAHFYGCNILKNVAVDAQGNLFPCIMDRSRSIGNLEKMNFEQYAQSITEERQKLLGGDESCQDCSYKKDQMCGGFCRFSNSYKK